MSREKLHEQLGDGSWTCLQGGRSEVSAECGLAHPRSAAPSPERCRWRAAAGAEPARGSAPPLPPTVHLGHFFRSWTVGQGGFHPVPKPYSGKLVPEVGPAIHVMTRGVYRVHSRRLGFGPKGQLCNSRQRGLPTGQSASPADLETLPSSAEAGHLVAWARPLTGAERPQGVRSPPAAPSSCLFIHGQVCLLFWRTKSASRPRSACPGLGVHSQPAREVLRRLHA